MSRANGNNGGSNNNGNHNLYNQWQKFCSTQANIPKSQVNELYSIHKHKLKKVNPTLWFDIVKKDIKKQRRHPEDESFVVVGKEEEEEETATTNSDKEPDDSNGNSSVAVESGSSSSRNENYVNVIKDFYVTLKEIKAFLAFLSSEPSRHVKAYIQLEDKTDQTVLDKWSNGMSKIMRAIGDISASGSDNAGGGGLIIDLKLMYKLIDQHLLKINSGNSIDDVYFTPVISETDKRIQILFNTKRETYINEYIIPVITTDYQKRNVVYFFYDTVELLNMIERRYKSEHEYQSSYIKTTFSSRVEVQFFTTHLLYTLIHAMLHLRCALEFKESYFAHDNHNYYRTVENIIPRSLYKYFIQPHLQ